MTYLKEYFRLCLLACGLMVGQAANAEGSALFMPMDTVSASKMGTAATKLLAASSANRPGSKSTPVKLLPAALLSNVVNVPLQDGSSIVLYKTRSEQLGDGHLWIGTTADKDAEAIFRLTKEELAGSIRYKDRFYYIEPIGDGAHSFIDGPKIERIDHSPDYIAPIAPATPKNQGITEGDSLSTASISTIRVLVVTSTGIPVSNATINLALAELNVAFLSSGIGATVKLAGQMSISSMGTVAKDVLPLFRHRPDVRAARETYAADVAMFVTDLADSCGRAYIGPADDWAYGVVDYACMQDSRSFSHEIGHMLGALHNKEVPDSRGGTYQHGWWRQASITTAGKVNPPPDPCFHTIMSYAVNCYRDAEGADTPRINYFSNPGVYYRSYPIGNASTADNSRMIRENVATVAAFRAAPPNDPDSGAVAAAVAAAERARAAVTAVISSLLLPD